MKHNTLCYIRWADASHGMDEATPSDMDTIELHEVGWLVREDERVVCLAMERQDDAATHRLWLAIPKALIVERRDFPLPRKRSKRD